MFYNIRVGTLKKEKTMHLQPNITLRNLPQSAAIASHIEKKIDKLNEFYTDIMHCDVVVEQAQRNQNQGKLYNARIMMTVPGERIAVRNSQNEDVYVAIRDAFNAERRKLLDYMQRRRREVKCHDMCLQGRVVRLFDHDRFGFIQANGEEYFFNHNNLVNSGFAHLEEGSPVQFIAAIGNKGLQAHRVSCGKHQIFGALAKEA